jgi:hypothetical protein
VVFQRPLRVLAGAVRIGVHECTRQAGDGVNEAVFGVDRDRVPGDHGQIRVDNDLAVRAQAVSDPTQLDVADRDDTRRCPQDRSHCVHCGRIDTVHQAPIHLAGGDAQYREDRHRDGQPHYRVGPVPTQRDAAGAE